MNITDVDDKTIRGAREKNLSLAEFTQIYIEAFFEDIDTLNILRADYYPRPGKESFFGRIYPNVYRGFF